MLPSVATSGARRPVGRPGGRAVVKKKVKVRRPVAPFKDPPADDVTALESVLEKALLDAFWRSKEANYLGVYVYRRPEGGLGIEPLGTEAARAIPSADVVAHVRAERPVFRPGTTTR